MLCCECYGDKFAILILDYWHWCSRGLPTGSAIRCHSSPSCAGAYDSGFVGPRLAPPRCDYWGSLGFFCSAPQDFGMFGVFCARFPPREARLFGKKKKPIQLSITLTVAVVAAHTTPHSITPKSTHHTRRDGARRAK